ncbi:MAG: T9SS type A sorting domain-containing protein, partial [Bacteroidota bacterium]
ESPAGGTFSGNSVSGSNFDASVGAGTYLITYTITDSISGCANSASQNMYVDACLGIETSNIDNYNIYPNPNNGQFFIESAISGVKSKIEIFDAQGKIVLTEEINSSNRNMIDASTLNNGIYLLRIIQGDQLGFYKITINK